MGLEETGILADDIHYIARNNGFIILPPNHLGESKEFFYEPNKEPLLGLFIYALSINNQR